MRPSTAMVFLAAALTAVTHPARATEPGVQVTVPIAAVPSTATSTATSTADGGASSSGSSAKTSAFWLGGAGLVGIAVGSIFGGLSMSAWSSATSGCGPAGNVGHCVAQNPSQVLSDHDSAQRDAAVSTVAFITGSILVVAGGAIYLSGLHPGAPSVAVSPAFGPGQAGFAMSGAF